MRSKIRLQYLVVLLLLLLTPLTLAACGSATATPAPAATTAAATTAAATTAAASNAFSGNGKLPANSGTPSPEQSQESIDRKIIRNATISIVIDNIEDSLAQLRNLAVSQGGYVLQENTNQPQGNRPVGMIVLQVPSQNYENAITKIRQLAKEVTRQESSAQDVTEEYVDLRSQIVNLQRTEQGLQKLMDKAQNLSDIMSLQKELTAVRGEIEQRQGRLNYLDKKAAMSTITVNLSLPSVEVPAVKPAEESAWHPAETTGEAWSASLLLLGNLGNIILRLVVFFWWLFPIMLVGYLIWRVRRFRLREPGKSNQV
ncbi:MAG TPA: DUF4349 domain-containing protein [Chloroflexia bacterium]|nr:DUF4349 domain-containing protein [Chloroflexia bacterium]